MLSTLLIRMVKRTLKRHQTGQAIIILALGFVILLGFVGIVTDVSLLYIRYAALRRAVDSAAVAAAGQMRTDRALTAPKLAAIQFLEFHGIRTSDVFVETCIDMPPDWGSDAWANPPDDGSLTPEEIDARQDQNNLYNEVCNDQRKLVRVTAYIESPTVFMQLFGFETITLTADAISETASLDVVVVLDVSESMLQETTYDTWDQHLFIEGGDAANINNRWTRWLPPRLDEWHAEYEDNGGSLTVTDFRREFLSTDSYTDYDFRDVWRGGGGSPDRFAPSDATAGNGLFIDFTPAEYWVNPSNGNTQVIDAGSSYFSSRYGLSANVGSRPSNAIPMRAECRVRINPPAAPGVFGVADSDLRAQFNNLTGLSWGTWDTFQNTHDFYGCCNDPTAGASVDTNGVITLSTDPANWGTYDFDFSDLVCQPFKEARDATRTFLQSIDFARGDRVAFVTFDRSAYLIDPDGYNYATDGGSVSFEGGTRSHMIDDIDVATEVLDRVIGVRAEPNFYYTSHNAGVDPATGTGAEPVDLWDTFSRGATTIPADTNGNGEIEDGEFAIRGVPLFGDDSDFDSPNDINANRAAYDVGYFDEASGTLTNGYHVRNSCDFYNAALPGFFSIWADVGDPGPLHSIMNPPIASDSAWLNVYSSFPGWNDTTANQFGAINSYETRASCRGTNVGAGLREANNALVSPITTRQEGAVWVIVLLGDGAAGATDPIPSDSSATGATLANPYQRQPVSAGPLDPGSSADPQAALYGTYGFCPSGQPSDTNQTGLVDNLDTPFCQDTSPTSRHSCNTDLDNINTGTDAKLDDEEITGVEDQTIGSGGDCSTRYDADDYARDWADYVAMDRRLLSGEQLPTIFTIGFNLDYPNTGGDLCADNIDMCLGESLLRYIADIGDNNEFDGDYGFNNVTYGEDYGNYYNAPDQESLGRVFDEIAGKLFTRLAG